MNEDFTLKYRPKTVADFVGTGQQRFAQVLATSVADGKPIQKVLLTGNSGLGKTSLAMFYAGLLNAEIVEINCVENAGVDFVRDLLIEMQAPSLFVDYKVYLLDEVHGWSGKAQEALLTPLESLPDHVIVVAASTEPQKLKNTLVSRFSAHHLKLTLPTQAELKRYMMGIFNLENISIDGSVSDRSVSDNGGVTISPQYAKSLLESAGGNIRTLIGLIQQAKTGIFTNSNSETSDSDYDVIRVIWQGDIRYDYPITDYEGVLHGLCGYALGVLRRDPGNQRAKQVLRHFGGGLPERVSPAVGFYHLLVKSDL